jgi:DNA-binding transcriptional LysR family regulator
MDYLAAMRAFVRSVELGSFSKAAAEDNQKVSTVSRYVSALEADLGAALLNRSTRRLHLTEVGSAFYERAAAILAGVEDARLAAMSLNATPQGLLRINIPGTFGRRHIVPHLKDFREAHPQIRLDVTLTDLTVDLIEAGTDVAVRIGALADSTLIAKRLAPHRRLLVCSPGYLVKHGALDEPGDLARHECLTFALQPTDAWYFSKQDDPADGAVEVKVSGAFRANDSEALLSAAKADMGIALLPSWLLYEEIAAGRVVRLLPNFAWAIARGPERAIWGVYPPKKTVSPKVRAFLTFFAERFGSPPYWDR